MSIVKAPGDSAKQRELDLQIGEVRLIIVEPGLVEMSRADAERITLVRGEALTIARVIVEHLAHRDPEPAVPHVGYAITGRNAR
jgi:hypothetical protein